MIIGTGNEDSGLLYSDVVNKIEILLFRTDPGGDLRELVAEVHAAKRRLPVLFRVDKEFGLAYYSVRTAEAVKHFVKVDYLIRRIGRAGLLAVAKGRVGYPYFVRH